MSPPSSFPKKRKKRIPDRKRKNVNKLNFVYQIEALLRYADNVIHINNALAQIYALKARKIQMKTRTRFPPYWKKRFCRHCKSFLYPGINAIVRLSSSNKVVTIKCLKCNSYTRFPYYAKKLRGQK
ncbi:MAG: ribonuclease P protein component 4 [Candidatus Heimdallarchaeaceae archaeon]